MQGRVKESMALVKVAQDRHREIPLEWVMGNGSFVTLETGDVVAAERGFQKALKAAPGDPMAHYGLGLCAIAEGRGALATSELRRAAELLPSDWLSRYTFGWELLWQRNAHEAEKQFRALVKIKPESPDGYMGLGYALAQQGKPALAGVEFRKVLSLWPECQQAQAGLAATEKAVGRNFDKSDG
jgi:superkiller protein 3